MRDERRIQELIEEALNSQRSPDDVCREFPLLLPHVRERLVLVRNVDEQLDALLPGAGQQDAARLDEHSDSPLPTVPGYELRGILGRGGMGVVYRAHHSRLDRDVALKMLLAGEFASARELERFFLEARAIGSLSHPNIVQVHDVSERDGRPFFTMELVEGGTLAQWLEGMPRPPDKAAELVACLAGAIGCAHEIGIVHRDLKPANVLLTLDGTPKITDFGLARRVSDAASLTASGAILGTPSYMAPEQIQGSGVGAAADVYALGAILYELLTGRPPFRSDTPLATQMQVLTKDPARPSLLNGGVPRDLETICLRCLHKDAARRYASAADLAADLRRFLAHEPIRARPVGRLERAWLWSRRHPTRATLISFGAVVLGVTIGRGLHEQGLSRARRTEEALWSPRIEGAIAQLRSGDFAQARSLLDQVPDTSSEEVRLRVGRARGELLLVEKLDGIRMDRVEITEGRFDHRENRRLADLAYDEVFRAAGLGALGDDAALVASRVRESAVRPALIGALDDWAFCAGENSREAWVLDVLREADPDPSPWRERLRAPALRLDEVTLAHLANDVRANRTTVQLLVGAAERMREAGLDVIPLLTVVQRVHPGDYWVNFALGDALWAQDGREAIRYLQAAVAIRPRSTTAHQALGTALRKSGRVHDSIEAYRQAVLVEPNFAEAHGRLGLALFKYAKDVDAAIVEFREAIRLDPELAWMHQGLGIALKEKGLIEEALDAQREAVRLDPRSGLGHQSLGDCLRALGRDREALGSYRMAAEVEPSAVHHYELGVSFARLDRLAEAEPELRRAIGLDAAHEGAKSALRSLLVRVGRGDEALAQFRENVQARPADATAWDGYAELCAYLGHHDEHRRACEELLQRFGDTRDPRVCERIGRACLLVPTESTRAIAEQLIERAVASDPSLNQPGLLPYFQVAKALADHRGGRFDPALELLNGPAGQVLTPLPDLIRAMALQSAGRTAEARHALANASLNFDWTPSNASDHDSWILHTLRKEAEALIQPEIAEALAGRTEPRDTDARVTMIGALLAADRQAAAARMSESVFGAQWGSGSEQPFVLLRVFARAGAGRGVDPADHAERARFRGLARSWLRSQLASFDALSEAALAEQRKLLRARLTSWSNDPLYAVLRDPEAMEELPPAEREECGALWRDVEVLQRRTEADS